LRALLCAAADLARSAPLHGAMFFVSNASFRR
jgi:hypothetical protein